ncbi:hypothetical protein ACIGJO_07335 [Streptomyces sp. NPDC079020]|uniref:hypothetical protein n=1 Tax=Streptomyces sp. NPDC079020 TaxID=3365722 RepID=UPI0037CE10FD
MTPPAPCDGVPHWGFLLVAVVLSALAAGVALAPVPRTKPEDPNDGCAERADKESLRRPPGQPPAATSPADVIERYRHAVAEFPVADVAG